jgi:hypothetical protein
MNTDKELLRRALEAWENGRMLRDMDDAMVEIRTFLAAEPEENDPVAWIQPNHLDKAQFMPFLCRVEPKQRDDFVPLYTRPEPEAEPVAWRLPYIPQPGTFFVTPDPVLAEVFEADEKTKAEPLYLHPPKPEPSRKPMTEEEIEEELETNEYYCAKSFADGIRYAEKHHFGMGVNPSDPDSIDLQSRCRGDKL